MATALDSATTANIPAETGPSGRFPAQVEAAVALAKKRNSEFYREAERLATARERRLAALRAKKAALAAAPAPADAPESPEGSFRSRGSRPESRSSRPESRGGRLSKDASLPRTASGHGSNAFEDDYGDDGFDPRGNQTSRCVFFAAPEHLS